MVQKNRFALLLAFIVCLTFSARGQDIKSGTCPASVNNRFSILSGANSFSGDNDFNPFSESSRLTSVPEYFPVQLSATSLGAGGVGTFPISDNYIIRASIINLFSSSSFGLTTPNSEGVLMPVEFGLRIPIINSTLGTMGYTLYGETTAGLLLGMSFPTGGSFLGYSIPNSRFATGASAYLGLGNTLRFDRYVGIYLNGGAGYFDLFSSTFMPRSNYFYPSISIGFYFNITQ